MLDIFPLDLVLSLGFVGLWGSACSTFLTQKAATPDSVLSLHRTICHYMDSYRYICYVYCYGEMKKCSCTHLVRSSMPYASEKGIKSHFIVKLGQIDSLNNMGALKIF